MKNDTQVTFDFYKLVRNTRVGYQFIQEDNFRTVDTFPSAEEAYTAADDSEDPSDIVVARVQIIKRK